MLTACYIGLMLGAKPDPVVLKMPSCNPADMTFAECAVKRPIYDTSHMYVVCANPLTKKIIYSGFAARVQET